METDDGATLDQRHVVEKLKTRGWKVNWSFCGKRYLIWLKQGHPAPISFYHDLIKQSSKFKLSARGGRLQNIASFCEFQIEVCQKNIKSISSHQDLQL